ncbi:glycosyltransferase family 4 protein [bacterium]|nr:glycosyltransferase family 4 protein [bacterium]
MVFVHVEDFFHPNAGYQVNQLSRLQVKQGHEVFVITSELEKIPNYLTDFFGKDNITEKDRHFEESSGVKVIRHPLYGYYSGRAIFKTGLRKVIKSLRPDVLFVHGEDTLTGIILILNYRNMNMPYVLDSHMLELASMNRFRSVFRWFFRNLITPIILRNQLPMIRVVDSDFLEKHYNIPLEKTKLLKFGTDTEFYRPSETQRMKFRMEHGISERDFVVVYAGKLNEEKGGMFLAKALQKRISLEKREIHFVIIGNTTNDSYGKQVEVTLEKSENRIIRFETQNYLNLALFYQPADIAVFPRQCSMSYFEVQSCGLAVILEENEINNNRVQNKRGMLFEENCEANFRDKITNFGNMSEADFSTYQKNARRNILENFNYVTIAQEFSDVMVDEYLRFHKK